jgi:DNA-directed RNA polymerase III subunit RPC3
LNDVDTGDLSVMKSLHVKEYVNILCAADNPSEHGRASAYMNLMMSGGGKKVTVEFEAISRRLRAMVLDNVVRDKWGIPGIRIIRILRDCGKLDSEQVGQCI